MLSGQVPQTSVSRSRSPTHHQHSPQTGVPRPSSDSLGGLGGQSASGDGLFIVPCGKIKPEQKLPDHGTVNCANPVKKIAHGSFVQGILGFH